LGQWLKRRPKELDLTQEDLAERIGCASETIRKIEAGKRRPSRQVVELLAECLGVAPDERPTFMQLARTPHASRFAQLPAAAGHAHEYIAYRYARTIITILITLFIM